jgi:hypothetical protein
VTESSRNVAGRTTGTSHCPPWCTDCAGLDDDGYTTHCRNFYAETGGSQELVATVSQLELDGSPVEAGGEAVRIRPHKSLTAAELRDIALALTAAADLMVEHGIGVKP